MAIFTAPDGLQYVMTAELAALFAEPDRHEFETKLIDWATEFLKPNEAFLDIGAHVGTWALPYARRVPKVIAIEANRQNYLRLCAGIALNDLWNIEPIHAAAAAESGELVLNVGVSDWSGFGGSVENYPINGETRPEPVPALALDDMEFTEKIGLVKIDVEGHEQAVLRGMVKTLEASGWPTILLESWAFEWYAGERQATIDFLASIGYNTVPVAGWEHMLLAAHSEPARVAAAPTPAPYVDLAQPVFTAVFSTLPRQDTTGVHLVRALEKRGVCVLRKEPLVLATGFIPVGPITGQNMLCIDDDHGWPVPPKWSDDERRYYWCIDSYRMDDQLYLGGTRRERLKYFDKVFFAQKREAEEFHGEWLPLAVDTELYRYEELDDGKRYDWCFIGNMNQSRPAFLEKLRAAIPNCFVGNAYGEDANRIYNQSRIAVNLSAGPDINMRVFEAQATSALLITNRTNNGEEDLFHHLPLFVSVEDCIAQMRLFLLDDGLREQLARAQATEMQQHTYEARARALLKAIGWPES